MRTRSKSLYSRNRGLSTRPTDRAKKETHTQSSTRTKTKRDAAARHSRKHTSSPQLRRSCRRSRSSWRQLHHLVYASDANVLGVPLGPFLSKETFCRNFPDFFFAQFFIFPYFPNFVSKYWNAKPPKYFALS